MFDNGVAERAKLKRTTGRVNLCAGRVETFDDDDSDGGTLEELLHDKYLDYSTGDNTTRESIAITVQSDEDFVPITSCRSQQGKQIPRGSDDHRSTHFTVVSPLVHHSSQCLEESHLSFSSLAPQGSASAHTELVQSLRLKQQKELEGRLLGPSTSTRDGGGPSGAERQAFLESQKHSERLRTWASVIVFFRSAATIQRIIASMGEPLCLRYPRCAMALRHALKSRRLQKLVGGCPRPTPMELSKDKLLELFTDEHLEFAAAAMRPAVFLPSEAITYCKVNETICFFIRRGSVDVRVGADTVATIPEGCSCGVMGMLTGEPRTATLIAKTTVFAWIISQEEFSAFPNKDKSANKAHELIREQRQANLRHAYRDRLEPSKVCKMYGMRKWPRQALVRMMLRATPHVFKKGEVLVDHELEDESEHAAMYVMNGRIRMFVRSDASKVLHGKDLVEQLMLVCGLARFRRVEDALSFFNKAVAEFDSKSRRGMASTEDEWALVVEVGGPLMLNVAPLVLESPTPIRIETSSIVDAMVFYPHHEVRNLEDPGAVAALRQETLKMLESFVETPPSKVLASAIFPKQSLFSFLLKVPFDKLKLEPVVFDIGSEARFESVAGLDDYYLVMEGTMNDCDCPLRSLHGDRNDKGPPPLWPDAHRIFFGTTAPLTAKFTTKARALRGKRQHFIELLAASLSPQDLQTITETLVASYRVAHHANPTFVCRGSPAEQRIKAFLKNCASINPVELIQAGSSASMSGNQQRFLLSESAGLPPGENSSQFTSSSDTQLSQSHNGSSYRRKDNDNDDGVSNLRLLGSHSGTNVSPSTNYVPVAPSLPRSPQAHRSNAILSPSCLSPLSVGSIGSPAVKSPSSHSPSAGRPGVIGSLASSFAPATRQDSVERSPRLVVASPSTNSRFVEKVRSASRHATARDRK